jgi:hypothetical protein
MSSYDDYLNRWRPRRLGIRANPDGEVHPLKALAIIWGVLLGLPVLIAAISPATMAIFRWISR